MTLMQLTKKRMVICFDSVPTGRYMLWYTVRVSKMALYPVEITEGQMLDLGTITVKKTNPQNNKQYHQHLSKDFGEDNSSSEVLPTLAIFLRCFSASRRSSTGTSSL
jgi:hypothetical protein